MPFVAWLRERWKWRQIGRSVLRLCARDQAKNIFTEDESHSVVILRAGENPYGPTLIMPAETVPWDGKTWPMDGPSPL